MDARLSELRTRDFEIVDVRRRYSAVFPAAEHAIDPLIDRPDEGASGAYSRQPAPACRSADVRPLRTLVEHLGPDR